MFTHRLRQPPSTTLIPDDSELMAGVLQGEELAWRVLYHRYHRLAAHLAYRITWDRTTTEDVVQDTFQSVWQSAANFQPTHSFRAWFTAIACHRAIDATRTKAFHQREREDFLGDVHVAEQLEDSAGIEDALVLREGLRTLLMMLPPAQRDAIRLMYYAGLTAEQIAAMLDTPLGTIKSRLRMGIRQLRVLLDIEVVQPQLSHDRP